MSMVPDITAGTGTESDETPGWWWPVGLSQSEGAHEMAVSVDGALFRVPGHLGVGRPSIYATALLVGNPVNLPHLARAGPLYDKAVYLPRSRWQPALAKVGKPFATRENLLLRIPGLGPPAAK